MNTTEMTGNAYGFLWTKSVGNTPHPLWHFHYMQEVITEPIVRGKFGIEVGAGCGYDTYYLAKADPLCHIVGMDLSDGVFMAKEVVSGLNNASIIKGSALDIPARDNTFDFAYSFGVLHHTPDPVRGLREMIRVVRKAAPIFVYLYEDHSDSPLKKNLIKITTIIRRITIKLPPRLLYAITCVLSPFVFIAFTVPARIFKTFKSTYGLYEKMPFNFARSFFSLRGDLYDRFSAPLEYRFGKEELRKALRDCGLKDIQITHLKAIAGLVAWGYKI